MNSFPAGSRPLAALSAGMLWLLLVSPVVSFSQGEIPVDMYTGQPQIDIPICTITDHDISVPISLSYSTNSLKFTDYGGTFGMGWELSGIGSVSREVRGLPDDFQGTAPDTRKGWLFGTGAAGVGTFANSTDLTTACPDELTDYTQLNGYNYLVDTEPDIFTFNLGSMSGSFVFDNAGNIRMIPMRDVKITRTTNGAGAITGFTITTNTGFVYTFDLIVNMSRSATIGSGVTTVEFLKRDYELYKTAVSYAGEWKLTRIKSPSSASVTFTYTSDTLSTFTPVNISLRHKTTSSFNTKKIYTIRDWVNKQTLASVYASSPGGGEKITVSSTAFVLTDARNTAAGTIRTYTLAYHVFPDTGRKFLKTITESGGCDQLPPYSFSYLGTNLSGQTDPVIPDPFGTNVNQQDAWGYFNGASGNTALFPTLYTYPALGVSERYRLQPISGYSGLVITTVGADRNSRRTDLGSLVSITYPTEGVATFDFEPNVYYDATAGQDITGGGLRIKSINYYDARQSTAHITKNFTYTEGTTGHSSGRAISKPVFAIPTWKYKDFGSPVATKSYESLGSYSAQDAWEYLTVRTENNLAPEETTRGSLIGYKEVKVSRPNTGYVKFEYTLPAVFGETSSGSWTATVNKAARVSPCPILGIIASGTAVGGAWAFPYARNPNFDYERGLMTRQTDYNEAGTKVRKTVKTYQYLYKSGTAPAPVYGLSYEKYANSDVNIYLFGKYSLLTDAEKTLSSETTTVYDDTDTLKNIVSSTSYVFGSLYHKLLTQVKNTLPDGTVYQSKTRYPLDFQGIPSSGTDKPLAMIKLLQDSCRHGIPVEQITTVKKPGESTKTIAASLVKYNNVFGNSKVLPEYQLSLSVATGITNFDSAYMKLVSSTYTLKADDRYETVSTILRYDEYGLPASQKGTGRVISSTHWGYNKTMPVVQAAFAKDDEFAFADFETSTGKEFTMVTPGFTQYMGAGRTGKNAHYPYAKLTRTLTKASVSNYILSFWINSTATVSFTPVLKNASGTVIYNTAFTAPSSGGTGFTYVSVTIPVTGVSSSTMTLELQAPGLVAAPVGGSSPSLLPVIDDLAFYPEGADLVSYTYAIPYGVSSVTDARKRTGYTEYDGLGRVKYTRDHDKNILAKNTYKFGTVTGPTLAPGITAPTGTLYDGDVLTFTANWDTCIDNISNLEWDMGTGSGYVSGSKVKTYAYTAAGTYTVTLRVTHPEQGVKTTTRTVTITLRPLIIDICAKGMKTYDTCLGAVTATYTCAGITTTVSGYTTAFKASVVPYATNPDPGPFTYSWEISVNNGTWTSAGSTQEASGSMGFHSIFNAYKMRCTITSQTAPYRSVTGEVSVYVVNNCM